MASPVIRGMPQGSDGETPMRKGEVGRRIVTAEDGRLGIVSITDVNRVLRALELADEPAARARAA